MSKRRTKLRLICAAVVLVLVLVMIYSGLRILESTVFSQQQQAAQPRKTILRQDKAYFPRQDITVILVMGIDEEGPAVSSGSYRNSGEADMVALVILDQLNETYSVLTLNRDMMLDMPALGLGGKRAGSYFGQLALSHTYGTGLEDSCENTREAVSDFLYGITIDYYVSMNMDAIGILNDAVGGVTVTVKDDFSEIDPTITMGELKLTGQQAINFIRTRKNVDDQTNISRMDRQEQYMDGFIDSFRAKQAESTEFIVSAYEDVSDYIVTNCSVNAFSGMMKRYANYELQDAVSPEGRNELGETYYEFYADEEKLDELILMLFYSPK